MSGPWTLVGDVVRLTDETDSVSIGAGGSTPPPKLEVNGTALVTLQDKGGNVFDVKAYGALGDGATDDLTMIHAAVQALREAGGGTLYFPPGRYRVSAEILIDGFSPRPMPVGRQLPFLVRGAGPGVTTLLSDSATAHTIRTLYGGANTLGRVIFMEVRDLSFGVAAGVTKTAGDAIRQECAPQFQNTFLVRNCWFRDVFNAVHLTSIGSAIITDCSFVDPKNAAIFLESNIPGGDVGTVNIANSYFFRLHPADEGTGVYGIHATTGASGIRIHNNVFIRFDHQVLIELGPNSQHTALNIDANLFDGTSLHPKVQITGFGNLNRFSISNNQFTCWQGSVTPIAGIQVDPGQSISPPSVGQVGHGSITDNVFGGNAPEMISKGIVLSPQAGADCHDVLVSGNVFNNLATGIEVGANTHRIYVSENAFEGATVTTSVVNNGVEPRGAFFPDRIGVGRPNDAASSKEIYAFSSQAARPRVYLQGLAGTSSPGIDLAFDNANVRRAAIVATAAGAAGVQLELFTKPDSGSGIAQRAVLDASGNLVWTSANYQEMIELGADPGAPGANKARLFLRDNGAGRTQLCVRFATGAVVVLATQP